jgi:hypothetical protein
MEIPDPVVSNVWVEGAAKMRTGVVAEPLQPALG